MHGLADLVFPPSMSEDYVAKAQAAGDDARYVPLPGVGHREFIPAEGPTWDVIVTQLHELRSV